MKRANIPAESGTPQKTTGVTTSERKSVHCVSPLDNDFSGYRFLKKTVKVIRTDPTSTHRDQPLPKPSFLYLLGGRALSSAY